MHCVRTLCAEILVFFFYVLFHFYLFSVLRIQIVDALGAHSLRRVLGIYYIILYIVLVLLCIGPPPSHCQHTLTPTFDLLVVGTL